MPAPANLVHQVSTATGNSNLALVAVDGKQTFVAAFGTGGTDTFDYFISNRDAAEWERGTGHESGGALVRDTCLENSAGSQPTKITFSAGVKDITNDIPAADQWGPIPITRGGTGQITQTAGFDALSPLTTQGDVLYHNGTDNVRLAAGTAGQLLRSGGAGANPSWFSANHGFFHVNRNNSNQTGLTGSAYNKIQFNTETDPYSYFDNATNYRYLPTVSGRYFFLLVAAVNYTSAAEGVMATIYKNGGSEPYHGTYVGATATESHSIIAMVINMNGSSDYVEFYCYVPSTVTSIIGANHYTFATGWRIGE